MLMRSDQAWRSIASPVQAHRPIEIWGGVECTVNRVGEIYFDQLERSGHALRLDDIDRCADLGLSVMRYPILWERTAPARLSHADWSWSDARLERLRARGIKVIAGLVHHGSGPRYTSLIDPQFADKLAAYARLVAERYTWLEFFTPINEPLTTARFSGWYGAWYPHGHDPESFKVTLLAQCRAVVLSMRAIRSVIPRAQLVQTEDLGKTYSTALVAYQAEFNNQLRWLGWDLLCGRVDHNHPLWGWLRHCAKAGEEELLWFQENRCPPDILGANHYVTSLRFLDERLENYPARFHGGNGRHRYVDIEAARCLEATPFDLQSLLIEAWRRYGLPVAVTECHIDSTRDDQLRWIGHMWRAAHGAKNAGADIRALTVWALFGAYDWNTLVTSPNGYYEPGAYDVRGAKPRPTAIARLVKTLASGEAPDHPIFARPGWWKRPERFFCKPVTITDDNVPGITELAASTGSAPLLISGATGTLGRAFARGCQERGLDFKLLGRGDMDIADPESVEGSIARQEPWAVVNAAGYVRVDEAENDANRCFRENTLGARNLAEVCERHRLPLLTFSSDLVFDGERNVPYIESDAVAPLNIYGKSKAEAEKQVLDSHPNALVVRTSAFFGPWDRYNFITIALSNLAEGRLFLAANDWTFAPTYVPDLVRVSLDLLIDGEQGIWHLTNNKATTWPALISKAAELAHVDASTLQVCGKDDLGLLAPRPSYSVLGSARAALMPPLDDALARYTSERERTMLPL